MNSNNSPDILRIRKVYDELVKYLTPDILTDIVSKLNAITVEFTGDGSGLSGGTIVDKFITTYLSALIPNFEAYHEGEKDCKILDIPLSIKKIRGKSSIALDWSKNGKDSKERERFDTDIMIINLKTEQWWKTTPVSVNKEVTDVNYSMYIKAGIYLISHDYCKGCIKLSSNNKTDSLIDSVQLYLMIQSSIKNNFVIEFPTDVPTRKFNILTAFESE